MATFPSTRLRRLRQAPWIRNLVREVCLQPQDLIWPVFVIEGHGQREAVPSMPGVERYSVDLLCEKAKMAQDLGIMAMAIFPRVDASLKSDDAREAINPNNLMCRAVKALKMHVPEMGVLCDVALDPYTPHGHDGVMVDKRVDNDRTLDILCEQALVQAQSGCDMLGPSDMMDGRIGRIRAVLESAGHKDALIMSYASKFASAFYGPFRDAVGSLAVLQGDKKTYQQDPGNGLEALREVALDIDEGADVILVKPGMSYLDIVYKVSQSFPVPVFVYQVSGEFAMIKLAGQQGLVHGDQAMLESLISMKRAGARAILTYAALDVAARLD